MEKTTEYKGLKVTWLGHSSFMIKGDAVVYIDPFKIHEDLEKADYILITHDHFDHMSIEDIKKILGPKTKVVLPEICDKKLNLRCEKIVVKPNQKVELGKITIETIPAYNLNKNFHPKASGFVGYIITINKVRIYHAGDTDYIIEMNSLKNIDIALMPIGGTYTMNPKEAADAVNKFKPKITIPMHYGSVVGSLNDAEQFEKYVKGPDVLIL